MTSDLSNHRIGCHYYKLIYVSNQLIRTTSKREYLLNLHEVKLRLTNYTM